MSSHRPEARPAGRPATAGYAAARRHRLADGRTVTVRPVRADDAARDLRFLRELPAESRYFRFQGWISSPSDRLARFLTDVDHDRHIAFVCTAAETDGEHIVGEARCVANPGPGASCDFGVIVADAWHGTGIAGLLMAALIEGARARGYASMEGLVLRRNAPMLRFARGLGFEKLPNDAETVRIVKRL